MIAQHHAIAENSTTVRSKIDSHGDALGLRNTSARLSRSLGGVEGRPWAKQTDRPDVREATADMGRLERLVTGLLTLIAAGYAVAVLVRIVALYA